MPVRDPAISSAVEDYAKAIYALEADGRPVTTTAIAERMGVTAASASGMVRKLCELGLVAHEPYKGVRLTERGRRRSRSRSSATTGCSSSTWRESLGVPWDRVHAEAEVLEHVLSEELEDLIAAKLGNPTRDPHGDPIPTRDLVIEERPSRRAVRARARRARHVRAHLRHRPRDAALPGRARDRARRPASRSSRSSRSAARCSPPSAATSSASAAGSPTRCGWRCRR